MVRSSALGITRPAKHSKINLCHVSPCGLVFGESMRLPGEFFESKDERLEHTPFANNLAKYRVFPSIKSLLQCETESIK